MTEYYQYLADNDISYGRLALEVVNNKGKYGLMANGHLKHQCVFDGIKVEEIPIIREQIIISLAYHDMAMRKSAGYDQTSDFCGPIEDYHISVFKSLATEYAWGGLAFRELVGSGSWLKLYEQGGNDLDAITMMFKEYQGSKEYSSTRLMDSIRHSWTNYHDGLGMVDPYMADVPFSPSLDGASKEYLAKLYHVSEDRVVEIDAPEPDAPMAAYKHYKILPANEYNSPDTTDIEQLANMLTIIVLTNQNKMLENQKKITKLAEKVNTLLTEYTSKVQEIVKDFVNNKSKNLADERTSLKNQALAEIEQIAASLELKDASLFAQKQAELDAESAARLAAAQQAIPTYSEIPTTITISYADIAARKQAEYDLLLAEYRNQCDNQKATIQVRYETQIHERKQAVELELSNIVNMIEQQTEAYTKELMSKVEEMEAKLSQGEEVDVDSLFNNIDIKTSTNLENIQNTVGQTTTIAHALIDIMYDNPVLNHPELIKQMANKFGSRIIDKLIDFGGEFVDKAEDKEMLENVCNKPNNVCTMAFLMGLNIPDSYDIQTVNS